MINLVDCDIILHLCACACEGELHKCLRSHWDNIYCNSELRRVLRAKAAELRSEIGSHGLERAKQFSNIRKMINDGDVDEDDFADAVDAGANTGEAELCAAIRSFYPKDVFIVSGDHAAIRSLHDKLPDSQLRTRLTGHIICAEQVLLELLALKGYDAMEPLLAAAKPRLRKMLRPYFDSPSPTEAILKSHLESRITVLHAYAPGFMGQIPK